MQTKVMGANVSACSFFSVWLLYINFLTHSAVFSLILAEILSTNSLNTVNDAEKIFFKNGSCGSYAGFH